MKYRYQNGTELMEVEKPVIGQNYHLSWASRGCVWKLTAIDGDKCTMVTRVSKKTITAKLKDLRHTRKNQSKHKGIAANH